MRHFQFHNGKISIEELKADIVSSHRIFDQETVTLIIINNSNELLDRITELTPSPTDGNHFQLAVDKTDGPHHSGIK